ncbi:hypothetical protein QC761_0111140 [Podospora bellae-mahoneyi]|uniref:Uncharacterized protein n=1 Tax=Podospora bellae-mahoneyi TaxID=2093777 RepID=A0ABR0F6S4_9PEZI|nr:hypothetical protein QC761_0111140 [Podospora bellae-mahoneyi]
MADSDLARPSPKTAAARDVVLWRLDSGFRTMDQSGQPCPSVPQLFFKPPSHSRPGRGFDSGRRPPGHLFLDGFARGNSITEGGMTTEIFTADPGI